METTLSPAFIEDLRARLRVIFGERLRHAVLYGSHARGEAHAESDVDVLAIIDGPATRQDEDQLSDLRMDAMTQHEQYLSIFTTSEERFVTEDWPYFRNVREEGIPLEALASAGDGRPAPLPPSRAHHAPGVMRTESKKLLRRAHRSLESSRHSLEADFVNEAISSAYYAVFHAATAAINEEGLAARSHRGTHHLFHQTYVATGRAAGDLGGLAKRLEEQRREADYAVEPGFSHSDAEQAIAQAEHFVEMVEGALNPPA